MMVHLTLVHLYPDLMNLYGDQGNLTCLQKRLEWYGYRARVKKISLGQSLDIPGLDFLFMGGGSDREQHLVYMDLKTRGSEIMAAIESGLPALFVCGAFQLLGRSYQLQDGTVMSGLGLFDFYTRGEKARLTGNVLLSGEVSGRSLSIVGFENHSGRTFIKDRRLKPLGRVVRGYGNNGTDQMEGAVYRNLIATYLHGPLLPKNPVLADFFIRAMLERRGIELDKRLDDSIENRAHNQVKQLILAEPEHTRRV